MTDYTPIWNDDEQLDRLVDGELSRAEYDRLLTSFDQHPQGWRRCALAFLEAQAWQKDLSAVRHVPAVGSNAVVTKSAAGGDFNWTPVLAVAASFLIAFALGLSFRIDWFRAGASGDPSYVVEQETPAESSQGTMDRAIAESKEDKSSIDSDRIQLVLDRGDGTQQPLDIPITEWSQDRQGALAQPSIPVPPEVQRMLQQAGHELRTKRQFVPFRTQDGREVLVPVDQLEITPVRNPRYQ